MEKENHQSSAEDINSKKRKEISPSTSAPAVAAHEATADTHNNKYQAEIVKPEWLELPQELKSIDFNQPASVAWNKYQPYTNNPPILTPVGTPPSAPTTTNDSKKPLPSSTLIFHLNAVDKRARACTIHFPNTTDVPIQTPRFMPVGTKGTLKGVLPCEIEKMQCPIILANTYHLAIQPGTSLIQSIFHGLPTFMGGVDNTASGTRVTTTPTDSTPPLPPPQQQQQQQESSLLPLPPPRRRPRRLYNLLTDSGGFQMVSLAALSVVTENGVVFENPYKKNETLTLRPEDSIRCQNEIGADIIMQLDDVISSVAEINEQRLRLATLRTLRWYDRCRQAHGNPNTQNLFPILQGHLDISKGGLRELCLAGIRHRDLHPDYYGYQHSSQIPGFAIGGLAGGESKDEFWRVVDHACRHLPDDRPRYLMGVGYPLDLVVCTALGVDLYDCVYPTRTARFGVALVDAGQMKLKQHDYALQHDKVIDDTCTCQACTRKVSRGRLHALLKSQNALAVQLLTQHNICYMMGLVMRMRTAILQGTFQEFVHNFLQAQFPDPLTIPQWVKDALQAAQLSLSL